MLIAAGMVSVHKMNAEEQLTKCKYSSDSKLCAKTLNILIV